MLILDVFYSRISANNVGYCAVEYRTLLLDLVFFVVRRVAG